MNDSPPAPSRLTIGQCASLACLLEATAPKVGNVHRGADFADMTFTDFAVSAVAIAPAMERASETGVGRAVLDAITATRALTPVNTNLGAVLLLAPLAAVPLNLQLDHGIADVLRQLTPADSRLVYEAIRVTQPGGLGSAPEADVRNAAPDDLVAAMRLAAERDLVARQYANNFADVLADVTVRLRQNCGSRLTVAQAIVHTQVQLLAAQPDSLIARKCGADVAAHATLLATRVLDAGIAFSDDYLRALADFDFWLRSDGHRRNPGTTADLLCAGLFVGFREGWLTPPFS